MKSHRHECMLEGWRNLNLLFTWDSKIHICSSGMKLFKPCATFFLLPICVNPIGWCLYSWGGCSPSVCWSTCQSFLETHFRYTQKCALLIWWYFLIQSTSNVMIKGHRHIERINSYHIQNMENFKKYSKILYKI